MGMSIAGCGLDSRYISKSHTHRGWSGDGVCPEPCMLTHIDDADGVASLPRQLLAAFGQVRGANLKVCISWWRFSVRDLVEVSEAVVRVLPRGNGNRLGGPAFSSWPGPCVARSYMASLFSG